ncbi:MAG TPA: DnaA regulatory inactivator Hda [Casimicrobiaceae bacterium]|nr:DnaA regulatory inactivator Hda [Casimicrobiaceae bacterium]
MTEQFVLDLAAAEPPSFDNFVIGRNREAVAALLALTHAATTSRSGILLWGATGAGKSHLLRASALAARASRPVVECATPREVPSVDACGDTAAAPLLIVDDIDDADPDEQGRLFTWINALAARGGPWIAAASLPPARMTLRADLRTRLALGLVLEVGALADSDKAQALEVYANERGFRLPADVIAYLLAHARRDMPSLVATLAALDRHSLASQRNVTIPLVRDWLRRSSGSEESGG